MALRKARPRGRPSAVGRAAPPVEGVDPAGMPVQAPVEGRTVFFLTSSCRPCRALWAELGEGALIVTPDPSTEDRRAVAALAPAGATVVMSSDAWFAYSPGPAPWQVTVAGGVVTSAGPAGPGS